jgi:2-amino-4-hydroxy-6-hydroxymethyldihydropteridine diphosphokinase
MSDIVVYIALGGNFPETRNLFERTLEELKRLGTEIKISPIYQTKPVSSIPQSDFLNACVKFKTKLGLLPLFQSLEEIEVHLGKVKKSKEAPRPIDLDLLFYGEEEYSDKNLQVPHPRFREREFVLKPLYDLADQIGKYNIGALLDEVSKNRPL